MFVETNPIPVKTALALMGKIGGKLRMPLCALEEPNREKLKKTLKEYKLI
jgi:4-hydroxy-tetrahydrodipicolinate synthase